VQTGLNNSKYTYNIYGNDNIGQLLRDGVSISRCYYLSASLWRLRRHGGCAYGAKDHLGSVRVTVDVNGTRQAHTDYYPFGMTMPGRDGVIGGVDTCYKFVANERDVETGYDHNGDRSYDSWSGRSTTLDPFAGKDPSWSPYSYAHDNPIVFCDVNGDSVWVTWMTGILSFLGIGTEHKALYSGGKLYENGQEYTGDDSYATAALGALNEIGSGVEGNKMLSQLAGSDVNYYMANGSTEEWGMDNGRITIFWNPNNSQSGVDALGNETSEPYINLAHELGHGVDLDNIGKGKIPTVNGQAVGHFEGEKWHSTPWYTRNDNGEIITLMEKAACIHENAVRAEHRLPLRKYYGTPSRGGLGKPVY
jgi:RHS repeat-associated protein